MAAKRGRKPAVKGGGPVLAKGEPTILKIEPEENFRPLPPEHLAGLEVEAWNATCDQLAARGILDVADLAIVENFAVISAMCRRIREELTSGSLTTNCPGSGRSFMNPLIGALRDYSNQSRAFLVELGLTPRSRKSPKGADEPPDPMDTFLAAKK